MKLRSASDKATRKTIRVLPVVVLLATAGLVHLCRTRAAETSFEGIKVGEASKKHQPAARPKSSVIFTEHAEDPGIPGLACYKIETATAIYFLEKTGAGLSSLLDKDGRNWIRFDPRPGSGAGGEFRGFPNAVYREAGSYFHTKNSGTNPSITKVERVTPDEVAISAVSDNGLWACRYDFFATHCTFTMMRMAAGHKYWVLYEGTPGGELAEGDWWMTSAVREPQSIMRNHDGDIPAPEWIVFGDARLPRVLFLLHHEDDEHPDGYYPMQKKMTVFGFGRSGSSKFLERVPQRFSIGFLETTEHAEICRRLSVLARIFHSRAERPGAIPAKSLV